LDQGSLFPLSHANNGERIIKTSSAAEKIQRTVMMRDKCRIHIMLSLSNYARHEIARAGKKHLGIFDSKPVRAHEFNAARD
jgi:hypothetical protein